MPSRRVFNCEDIEYDEIVKYFNYRKIRIELLTTGNQNLSIIEGLLISINSFFCTGQ